MDETLDVDGLAARIEEIVRATGVGDAPDVPLHEPTFRGNEWSYVKECIDTGWVSSVGDYVDAFEERLAEITGAGRAVVTVNGTAALEVALRLVGAGREDEVLVPALTFVATANAVAYRGAVPHFVDSADDTLGLDPLALEEYLEATAAVQDGVCLNRETGRPIRAVVPMHTFGHPVDMEPLRSVAERFCLEVVEDAAESLGSFYRGHHTGTLGRLGVLSFNGNKIVTTGGGGAIITDDEALADEAKHLTTTAKKQHAWEYRHDQIGYNYRMPNINAALGCAQLEQLPVFLERKRRLARYYRGALEDVRGVQFFDEPKFGSSNYWLNSILLESDDIEYRDAFLEATNERGIRTRPVWTLMSNLPMYRDCPCAPLPVAESLERRLVNLPSSPALGEQLGNA